jgi:hypothetical protein
MAAKRRCPQDVHEILLVENFTPMGAQVICLRCEKGYHLYEPEIEASYTGFSHTSHLGPDHDLYMLVLDEVLV